MSWRLAGFLVSLVALLVYLGYHESPLAILFITTGLMAIGAYVLIHSVLRKQYSLIKEHGVPLNQAIDRQALDALLLLEEEETRREAIKTPPSERLGRFLDNCRVIFRSKFRFLAIWMPRLQPGWLNRPRSVFMSKAKRFPKVTI